MFHSNVNIFNTTVLLKMVTGEGAQHPISDCLGLCPSSAPHSTFLRGSLADPAAQALPSTW